MANSLGDSRQHPHVASTFKGGAVNVAVMFEDMTAAFIAKVGVVSVVWGHQ